MRLLQHPTPVSIALGLSRAGVRFTDEQWAAAVDFAHEHDRDLIDPRFREAPAAHKEREAA